MLKYKGIREENILKYAEYIKYKQNALNCIEYTEQWGNYTLNKLNPQKYIKLFKNRSPEESD